ncbi:hypothetical protein CERZMDRAFT_84290 [Cercospora zeae-maydis SCOH1-5]|uniref:Uncharacterized protein n=1 Tax=Cercospora zeae-maydis SCOH1-5 TaxID=717836 RepID=A0A6A6FGV2_9PEZI|nr:hypothetical protein CERZMDRAFT_84290 [Cercospora zeae-maydis SCOH1-5]
MNDQSVVPDGPRVASEYCVEWAGASQAAAAAAAAASGWNGAWVTGSCRRGSGWASCRPSFASHAARVIAASCRNAAAERAALASRLPEAELNTRPPLLPPSSYYYWTPAGPAAAANASNGETQGKLAVLLGHSLSGHRAIRKRIVNSNIRLPLIVHQVGTPDEAQGHPFASPQALFQCSSLE